MNARVLLVMLLALVVFGAGCERDIESRVPVRSVPEDGPVPVNLTVSPIDGGLQLSWDVSGPDTADYYRVYAADAGQDPLVFALEDSASVKSIELTNLRVNQNYLLRVAAVLSSGLEWDPSEAIPARVSFLSITLNNGAEYTPDRTVQVRVNGSAAFDQIKMSEDPTLANASYIPLSGTTAAFELSSGDTTKFVYAMVKFSDGSESGSKLLTDSIILDTRAAIDSVFFSDPPIGSYFTSGQRINFGVDAGETGGEASVSFGTAGNIPLADDGIDPDPVADDGVYWGGWTVPTTFTFNSGEVLGRFTDRAGNSELLGATRPLTIFTAPLPVAVSAVPLSTYQIALSWTQSGSANFSSYRIYRDTNEDVDTDSELLTTLSGVTSSSYTDGDLDAGTEYFYRIYVFDNSGLSTGSEVVSASTFDNTVPDPVQLFAVTGGDNQTVDLSWTRSDEGDFESYRVYRATTEFVDTNDILVVLERNQGVLTSQVGLPTVPVGSGIRYYFRLYVYDRHGAVSESNVVNVAAPEG